MKLRISKSKKTKVETNCWFAVFSVFTAHLLLLLKAYFLGKPNASLLDLEDLQPSRPEKNKLAWVGYS